MYRNILVATDGSRLSAKAITHAIALARALRAKLTAFYASPDYPLPAYADGVMYDPVSPKEYAAMCKKEADRILEQRLVPVIHRPESMLRERLPVGSAAAFAEKLIAYRDSGLRRVLIWPVADEQRQLEMFCEKVRPALSIQPG